MRTIDLTAEPEAIKQEVLDTLESLFAGGDQPRYVSLVSPWNEEHGYLYINEEIIPDTDPEDICVSTPVLFNAETYAGTAERLVRKFMAEVEK